MHIEIIGATSAGKTTLAKQMIAVGKAIGVDIVLSDDFMLQQTHLSWIQNEFIRRRLVETISLVVCFTCLNRYGKLFKFVLHETKNCPGSWFYKINRIRNVVRKFGIFEFISQKSQSQQFVVADNEGILQGVHNLFVHEYGETDLCKITRYAELVPLPDVVVYLQQEEDVLVARTLARGHARLSAGSPDRVVHFIKQAIAVFNEITNVPKVQERLLIVDGELNVQHKTGESSNVNFHGITQLVGAEN
jgi:hypothetical protein